MVLEPAKHLERELELHFLYKNKFQREESNV